jgi:hypothetical protein
MAEDQDSTEAAERAADDTSTTEQPARADIPPEVKRALNKANKEAEALRLKLKEFEDRDKSEQQKLTEAHAAAEKRAAEAELRATKLEIAADKGLTPAQARRLVGATREELEADAEDILRDFPAVAARPAGPRPDPSQGARGSKPSSGRDAALAEIQKRFGTKSTVT